MANFGRKKGWASVYRGLPDILRVERQPFFMACQSRKSTESFSVLIQAWLLEVHNAIGVGEGYHAPLRRVFNAIRIDDTEVQTTLAMRIAVMAVNDTMGLDGLVPSLLVYRRL